MWPGVLCVYSTTYCKGHSGTFVENINVYSKREDSGTGAQQKPVHGVSPRHFQRLLYSAIGFNVCKDVTVHTCTIKKFQDDTWYNGQLSHENLHTTTHVNVETCAMKIFRYDTSTTKTCTVRDMSTGTRAQTLLQGRHLSLYWATPVNMDPCTTIICIVAHPSSGTRVRYKLVHFRMCQGVHEYNKKVCTVPHVPIWTHLGTKRLYSTTRVFPHTFTTTIFTGWLPGRKATYGMWYCIVPSKP